ncbi:hypothetical protein D3C85_1336790 [compost metagenome]
MRSLEYRGLSRPIRMREDGQALQGQLYGVTRKDGSQGFPVVGELSFYPADIVAPPVGQKSVDWVKTLKPELLQNSQIKRVGN